MNGREVPEGELVTYTSDDLGTTIKINYLRNGATLEVVPKNQEERIFLVFPKSQAERLKGLSEDVVKNLILLPVYFFQAFLGVLDCESEQIEAKGEELAGAVDDFVDKTVNLGGDQQKVGFMITSEN